MSGFALRKVSVEGAYSVLSQQITAGGLTIACDDESGGKLSPNGSPPLSQGCVSSKEGT